MSGGHSRFKTINMKLKLICLLITFLICSLAASPNRYCNGWRSTNKKQMKKPVRKDPFHISRFTFDDDADLLPTTYFLNHI